MSAIALLSLLGIALFIPVFTDDDDAVETPDAPETPDEPVVVDGTEGADLLTASSGQTVNGLDGNDTLTVAEESDGAVINGDAGDDVLTLDGTNATARGGAGNDTIISIDVFNGVVEGGEGDDVIEFQPLRPGDALDGTEEEDLSRVDGGAGDDTIFAEGFGGDVLGGTGNDEINVQGPLDLVEGGDGDDTITYNTSPEGGGLTLSGGAGDDVIEHLTLNSTPENLNSLTINAGDGDDRLLSSANIAPDADNSGDTLTGGAGADSFELTFYNPDLTEPARDAGIVTTITDFDTDEDVVLLNQGIEPSQGPTPNLPFPATITGFELVEAADGSFTDVIFEAADTGGDGVITGTIRLLGTTGVTATNIAISAIGSGASA